MIKPKCIREVFPTDRKALKEFIVLERVLLGGCPLFVSNLDHEATRYLSGKSAFTCRVDISLFIASDGNKRTFGLNAQGNYCRLA